MAIPTFNDGDPIDAATIQSLAQEVARLQASIPKTSTAGTSINLTGSTGGLADIVIPKVYGGRSEKITLTAGSWKSFTINFSAAGFSKTPNSVVLTTYAPGTSSNRVTYESQIVKVTKDSAECKVRGVGTPTSLGSGDIYMYYIAIQNS